jgi:hypothetical protein
MVMKKASGGDSPLRKGAGKSFWTPRSRIDDGGGLQYVLWKRVQTPRVFSMEGLNRWKDDIRGWTRRSHPLVARPGPGLRHQ